MRVKTPQPGAGASARVLDAQHASTPQVAKEQDHISLEHGYFLPFADFLVLTLVFLIHLPFFFS